MRPALMVCLYLFCFTVAHSQDIKIEKIAELQVELEPPVMAGAKAIFPIKGGTVTGKINRKILPVGGGFGVFVSPTTFKVDIKEVIETTDGATIYITYPGYIHADTGTFSKLTTPAK